MGNLKNRPLRSTRANYGHCITTTLGHSPLCRTWTYQSTCNSIRSHEQDGHLFISLWSTCPWFPYMNAWSKAWSKVNQLLHCRDFSRDNFISFTFIKYTKVMTLASIKLSTKDETFCFLFFLITNTIAWLVHPPDPFHVMLFDRNECN